MKMRQISLAPHEHQHGSKQYSPSHAKDPGCCHPTPKGNERGRRQTPVVIIIITIISFIIAAFFSFLSIVIIIIIIIIISIYHHYLIFQQVEHHHHQNQRLLISLAKKQNFHFSDFATTAVFDIIVSGVAAN